MIPEFLALDGFIGYQRRTELDFSGRKTIGVTGPNQVGKTSLLHAISYALYGRTLAQRDEQLINDFRDDMVVELRVTLPGKTLEITRGKTSKNEAICKVAGFRTRKASEAARYIAEELRLSYKDFVGLSYFQQGDIHGFMGGDKRAYFTRWTASLGRWETLEGAASQREKHAARELDALDVQQNNAKRVLENAEEMRAEERAARAGLAKAKADAELLHEAVKKLQTQETRSESQESLKQAIDTLRDQLRTLDRQSEASGRQEAALQKQIAQEAEGVCPLLNIECGDLTDASRKRKAVLHQQVREIQEQAEELQRQRENVVRQGKRLNKRIVHSPIAQIKADLKKSKRDLNDANRELQNATRRLGRAEQQLDAIETAEQQLVGIGKEMRDVRAKLHRSQFLRFMCGKNGIPATIIEGELAHVEERCNWIFDRLDYPKQIRFKGYRELGGFERICPVCGASSWHSERCKECGSKRPRKRKEEPTVTIVEGSVERPFELESGGAKVITSFAVRLASGLFVSAMTGAPLDMIILDEVFAFLDRSNRAKIMAMVIDKLSTEFGIKRQFVISHEDDITHTIDDLIIVRKERGSSVAQWA